MFEKLTARTRRVIVYAQEAAMTSPLHYIGTEDLLLGLIEEDEGNAGRLMQDSGISGDRVRAQLGRGVGGESGSGFIPFSRNAKEVLESSLGEASRLGSPKVDTEHLLLGLISVQEGTAVRILVSLGADLDGIRRDIEGGGGIAPLHP